jgi:hypothetical protein
MLSRTVSSSMVEETATAFPSAISRMVLRRIFPTGSASWCYVPECGDDCLSA